MQDGQRQGKPGNFIINFQSWENQKISPFSEKIRGASGGFIMNEEKNQTYMIFSFDFPKNVSEL